MATQSIQYLDRDVVTAIARVYAIQHQLDGATRDITLVMYTNAGDSDIRRSLAPFAKYFGDCAVIEPRLKHERDSVIERVGIRGHCFTLTCI